jgi:PAS domain-containing protein
MPEDAMPEDAMQNALPEKALADARAALAAARDRLEAAHARDELLAERVARRFRADTFRPIGRVWRLGVLLLGRDGALHAAGQSIRVDELRHDNHQSNLAAERRAVRAMALAAGVPAGETLDYDAEPIALDAGLADSAGPVILNPDGVMVRWNPGGTELVPFERYLDERAGLLTAPSFDA